MEGLGTLLVYALFCRRSLCALKPFIITIPQ